MHMLYNNYQKVAGSCDFGMHENPLKGFSAQKIQRKTRKFSCARKWTRA